MTAAGDLLPQEPPATSTDDVTATVWVRLVCRCFYALCSLTLAACVSSAPNPELRQQIGELRASVSDVAETDSVAALLQEFEPNDELAWTVFVPQARSSGAAPGVLVFISPSNDSGIPAHWLPALEEGNLLTISPNRAGNRERTTKRIALALSGLLHLMSRYDVDRSRIYLSGFSGGARVSGLAVGMYPSLFSGAIYIGGAEMWPGGESPQIAKQLRAKNFVFIAGSSDFNLGMVRSVWSRYRSRGLENSKLEVVRHMGHELPNSAVLAEAITYLDAR